MMDHSDANSSSHESEQPRNWRDQAGGFSDDFGDELADDVAAAADEPTRQWATMR